MKWPRSWPRVFLERPGCIGCPRWGLDLRRGGYPGLHRWLCLELNTPQRCLEFYLEWPARGPRVSW